MTLKENIQSNKGKALYYIGIILAACFKEVIQTIQTYLPVDTWWGDSLLIISGYAIVAISIIAPLIFGTDGKVERVKEERKELGQKIEDVMIMNEGLRVTNILQKQLMEENNLKPIIYTPEGKYKIKNDDDPIKEL